jgi:hypothetical protein
MIRKILVLAIVASFAASLSAACKDTTRPLDEAGKPIPKLFCKLNNQCWICPDDAAMTKCIINPTTSGCKQGGITDCP